MPERELEADETYNPYFNMYTNVESVIMIINVFSLPFTLNDEPHD